GELRTDFMATKKTATKKKVSAKKPAQRKKAKAAPVKKSVAPRTRMRASVSSTPVVTKKPVAAKPRAVAPPPPPPPAKQPKKVSLAALLEIGREVLGIDELRPGQEEALREILAGRDVLAVMPTGSGKSLLYQLPSLALPGLTVVVSPLIALIT